MNLQDLPYELRLCTELLHYAGICCRKTQDMTSSQIKTAVGVFFEKDVVEEATSILCGTSTVVYKDGKPTNQ